MRTALSALAEQTFIQHCQVSILFAPVLIEKKSSGLFSPAALVSINLPTCCSFAVVAAHKKRVGAQP